ncbi:hypothetical protein EJ03DRAFT_210273 [Teratosphaeria nubilosa]|uniref:Uncharacterized protein n=1 Tax=Teratosphaeria nubilosa TaxID=161662 RepID=A0A6G1KY99_9PEZI|nr:hypothetical protein EJ03DRAFT_210273 [Teratosphaeria nubilosa]
MRLTPKVPRAAAPSACLSSSAHCLASSHSGTHRLGPSQLSALSQAQIRHSPGGKKFVRSTNKNRDTPCFLTAPCRPWSTSAQPIPPTTAAAPPASPPPRPQTPQQCPARASLPQHRRPSLATVPSRQRCTSQHLGKDRTRCNLTNRTITGTDTERNPDRRSHHHRLRRPRRDAHPLLLHPAPASPAQTPLRRKTTLVRHPHPHPQALPLQLRHRLRIHYGRPGLRPLRLW